MAFGLNKVQIIGRLGADVTVNHLTSGGRVANLSIATDESYINKQTGEKVDKTEWHRVVTFQDGLIDMFEKHAVKGRLVYVDGKLQTRRWSKPGEDGDRFSTEILLVPGRPGAIPGQAERQRRRDAARPGHGGRHQRGPGFGARGPGRRDPLLEGLIVPPSPTRDRRSGVGPFLFAAGPEAPLPAARPRSARAAPPSPPEGRLRSAVGRSAAGTEGARRPATEDDGMRIYNCDEVCPFRFTRAAWGAFSNFAPLAAPIAAGPWTFQTSEHLYQAAKFGAAPAVQRRIAGAPTAREAAAIGRGDGRRPRPATGTRSA